MKWFESVSTLDELKEAMAALEATDEYKENAEAIQEAYKAKEAELTPAVRSAEEAPAEKPTLESVMASLPEMPEKEKHSNTPGLIALFAAILLLAAAGVIALVYMGSKREPEPTYIDVTTEATEAVVYTVPADGNPDDETCKGTYTVPDADVAANRDIVVATCGDDSLTLSQFQVYYWMEVQSFLNQYGNYIAYVGLDLTKGFDVQPCGMVEGKTWQQLFVSQALGSWQNYSAMAQKGIAAGVEIKPEYQAQLDSMENDLETSAQSAGYTSGQEMLEKNMGTAVTMDDYKAFLTTYFEAMSYYEVWTEENTPKDGELESYFDAHEAIYDENGLKKDTVTVDVRHILIMPKAGEDGTVTDTAKLAAETSAKELLEKYLSGEKTEEAFALLANEHSEDPGSSQNGGLYQGVTEGQMVPTFNDWCFDAARQAGDTDIVETDYGYHVMYFVGSTPVWMATVRNDILSERAEALFNSITENYAVKADYSKIAICDVNLLGE